MEFFKLQENETSYVFTDFNPKLKFFSYRIRMITAAFTLFIMGGALYFGNQDLYFFSLAWDSLVIVYLIFGVVVSLQVRTYRKIFRNAIKLGKKIIISGKMYTPGYSIEISK